MFIRISLTALLLAGCIVCLSLVVTQADSGNTQTPIDASRLIAQSSAPTTAVQ